MAVFVVLLSLLAVSTAKYGGLFNRRTKLSEICTPDDIPAPEDPCRPGGLYDSFFRRCTGYRSGDFCYQCHKGPLCKEKVPLNDCELDAALHVPHVYDEYWSQFGGAPCIRIPNPYRLSYMFGSTAPNLVSRGLILPELDTAIRKLHALVQNAETDGYTIVPSFGATQGIVAAVYALSTLIIEEEQVEMADVYAQTPFYNHLPYLATNLMKTATWNSSADLTASTTIEIVTWANNPDGQLLPPIQQNPRRRFFDLSYYWPTFTVIPKKIDEEIMVVSGSKNSGLAGSRSGWLLVKDPEIADRVIYFIGNQTLAVSIDTQLRQLVQTNQILDSHKPDRRFPSIPPFYEFMAALNRKRVKRLTAAFKLTTHYTYVNAEMGTIGAVAWMKCNDPGCDCYELLMEVNLIGESGTLFGATKDFVRLTLGNPDVEFNLMLRKLLVRFKKTDEFWKEKERSLQRDNVVALGK